MRGERATMSRHQEGEVRLSRPERVASPGGTHSHNIVIEKTFRHRILYIYTYIAYTSFIYAVYFSFVVVFSLVLFKSTLLVPSRYEYTSARTVGILSPDMRIHYPGIVSLAPLI